MNSKAQIDERVVRMLLDLRQGGVTDKRVLDVMEKLPRDLFIPQAFQRRAYENVALPMGHQQTVSQPVVVGQMTQALEVQDRMKVLEIGTGSGYQAAVLARLCRRLYTIERYPELLAQATQRLQQLRITNVTWKAGDGTHGWPEQAPFDRIMVTAAAVDVPTILVEQLKEDGIMVVPVGFDKDQRLVRVTRTPGGIETHDMGPVLFVPLVAATAGD